MITPARVWRSRALLLLLAELLPCSGLAASSAPFPTVDVNGNPVYLQALRDWQASRFDEVLTLIRPLAESGDGIAQFLMGGLYAGGNGVEQSAEQAAQWWLKAAEQGIVPAQNEIGIALADGTGVPVDLAQAVVWYRKAAERGFAAAQLNLGLAYGQGLGVRRDDRQAALWYRKAADQGLGWGQFHMGLACLRGVGVPKNEALAADWFRKAAEQNYMEAQYNLGMLYSRGGGVRRDRNQAAHWLARAAQRGHEDAERSLKSQLSGLQKIRLTDGILVRKNPDDTAEVIGMANREETGYELARQRGWVEIWLTEGTIGYIRAELVPAAPDRRKSGSSPR